MITVTVLIPQRRIMHVKITSLYGDSLILLLGRFSAMRFGHPLSQFPDSQTMMQQLYMLIPNVQLQS